MNFSFLIFMSWVRAGAYCRMLEYLIGGPEWTLVSRLVVFIRGPLSAIFCTEGAFHA